MPDSLLQKELISSIFNIKSLRDFNELAIEIFRFQAKNNDVYKEFLSYLNITPNRVRRIGDIPHLPIELFKNKRVVSVPPPFEAVFESSGTTGANTSKHYVQDLSLYELSYLQGFELFYGQPEDYCFLALLPSYLERENSSLVYMARGLINASKNENSGFYLDNYNELLRILKSNEQRKIKSFLLGVSFALLDLVDRSGFNLAHTIVMETGGMKGRRREMIRSELHDKIKAGFGIDAVHSEYGMTELLSQAYSPGNGVFNSPPWLGISIHDIHDPFREVPNGETGTIAVMDLANLNSCSFIMTRDLGKKHDNGTFEVLGRYDHSDVRGCNLLI